MSTPDFQTLEEFLDHHKGSGFDSSGQFTINPERARELLKNFQLPDPKQYLIHLVCFLMGARVSKIDIEMQSDHLLITSPDGLADPQALANPFAVLLRKSDEPYLKEFAIAVNTVLTHPDGRVRIHNGEIRADYSNEGITEATVEPIDGFVVRVTYPPSLKNQGQHQIMLEEAFCLAPVPVCFSGNQVNQPLASCDSGLEMMLGNQDLPLPLHEENLNRISRTHHAPFTALLRFEKMKAPPSILFLGRRYPCRLPWSFNLRDWHCRVLISLNQVNRDLSLQNILIDSRLTNLFEYLKIQMKASLDYLLQNGTPLEGAEEFLDDLAEELYQSGQIETVFTYQTKLCQNLRTARPSFTKGNAVYRLGCLQKRYGHADANFHLDLGARLLDEAYPGSFRSDWAKLRAQMAFTPHEPRLRAEVQAFIVRPNLDLGVLERCLRWQDSSRWMRSEERLFLLLQIARVCKDRNKFAEAKALIAEIESSPDFRRVDADGVLTLTLLELDAEIAAEKGNLQLAVDLFGKHLELLRASCGQYHSSLGLTIKRLVFLLESLDQKDRAKEYRRWAKRLGS